MDAEYSRRGLTYVLKADSLIFPLCVWMLVLIKISDTGSKLKKNKDISCITVH